jgi:hypothetical protein
MLRAATRTTLLLLPIALLEIACSRPPEQQMLNQYFRAARNRDSTTASMMSTVSLDPRTQGSIEDFAVTSVGPERREPLPYKALIEAADRARAEEADFQRRKKEYSNANLKTIEEILKIENQPNVKFTPAQAKVKPEWDKWRADTATYVKNLSAAQTAVTTATAIPEASLSQPGQQKFDVKSFDGEMVTKDVMIKADVRTPEGQGGEKDLVVTLSKVVGKQGETVREGKWIITKIAGL